MICGHAASPPEGFPNLSCSKRNTGPSKVNSLLPGTVSLNPDIFHFQQIHLWYLPSVSLSGSSEGHVANIIPDAFHFPLHTSSAKQTAISSISTFECITTHFYLFCIPHCSPISQLCPKCCTLWNLSLFNLCNLSRVSSLMQRGRVLSSRRLCALPFPWPKQQA